MIPTRPPGAPSPAVCGVSDYDNSATLLSIYSEWAKRFGVEVPGVVWEPVHFPRVAG
jgi:hypothetical protein